MKEILKKLKNPPSEYRPLPFWSWNTRLDAEETKWQINEMQKAGMGGFFMHARGGLTTEYLGTEWMENISASIDEAKKHGLGAWGYDENGWPSGFGSDAVNGLGIEYQQKFLRLEYTDKATVTEATITNISLDDGRNAHFYYEINPFYVDTLDGRVTDEFIKSTHEKYKEFLGSNFGNMAGFFTDEPQISRNGLPWSFTLEEKYTEAYGEQLLPLLYDLFEDTSTATRTRFRFWKLVTRLFSENYMGKLYEWCDKNGVRLTGHLACEEGHTDALTSNGAVMPSYEYMHIPGIDKLRREVDRYLLIPQVTSVAAQLGKKQILTESFALCGWDVTFEELKHIYEWQMVKGVNLLCQHLVPYSLEGLRKRDYPAGHFYQNPWWEDYKVFNDFAARMGMLLCEGETKCDILVLHTMADAWTTAYNNSRRALTDEVQRNLFDVLTLLDKNGFLCHLGDDRIMKKYAKVENGKLYVGKMAYSLVIIPKSSCIDSHTLSLIEEFEKSGGRVIFAEAVPTLIDGEKSDRAEKLASTLAKSKEELISLIPENYRYCGIYSDDAKPLDIQYAYRKFEDFEMYYLVNTFDKKSDAVITLKGKSCAAFDYFTGEILPIHFTEENGILTIKHTFCEKGSVVLFVRDDDMYSSRDDKSSLLSPLGDKLFGRWEIENCDDNILTLDRCDVYFDGNLIEKDMCILDVQQLACDIKRKVRIALDFDVNFDRKPVDKINLVIENPENYTIYINGKIVEKNATGYFRDKSFKKIDVTGLFDIGYNILTLETNFMQSKEVYEAIENSTVFESVKNKLYYDMEIEPIYLIGEFAVNCSEDFTVCDGGHKTSGRFSLAKMPFHVNDGPLSKQGFPFFSGKITLKKTISLTHEEITGRSIEFSRLCGIITKITVNRKALPDIFIAPYTADLSSLLVEGENEIQIELCSSLQNMLGPHHFGCVSDTTGPSHFHSNRPGVFSDTNNSRYDKYSYSFSDVGIFLK